MQYTSEGTSYNLCSDQWTICHGDKVCEQLGFGYAVEVGMHYLKSDQNVTEALKFSCQVDNECRATSEMCHRAMPLLTLECSGQNGEYIRACKLFSSTIIFYHQSS